jgi:hypothetical protein
MIDKVKLWTQDFTIAAGSQLTVKGADLSLATGESEHDFFLFMDKSGNRITGSRAYINSPEYQVTIDRRGLFLQYTPAVVFHGCNYFSVTSQQNKLVADKVEHDLADKGIYLSLGSSAVSRLDLANNIITDNKVSAYSDLFESLSPKRSRTVKYNTEYYRYGNNSRQAVFYNKIEDLKDKWGKTARYNLDKYGINGSANILRGETRWLRASVIKKDLSVYRLSDTFEKDQYEHLRDCYRAFIRERVFETAGQQQALNFETELETLKRYKEQGKNSAIKDYLVYVSIEKLIQELGSLDKIETLICAAGYSQRTAKRTRQYLQSVLQMRAQQGTADPAGITAMYTEILNKLVA